MEEVKIKKENIIQAYKEGSEEVKKALVKLTAGKVDIVPKDATGRIKSFEDACEILGIKSHQDAHKILGLKPYPFDGFPISECVDPYLKLMIIAKALNDDWQPDWNDENQKKWQPYFAWDKEKQDFGFSNTYCDSTNTDVGSRLCFKLRELAEYAGRQFENIFAETLNQ